MSEMGDKSTAQAGHFGDETQKDNASAGVSTATLNSPEQPSEIEVNKEVLDDNSTQNETSNEKSHVDAADAKGETASENSTGEWRFTRRAQLVFATLATLSLMVALDGTSISVALPVCFCFHISHYREFPNISYRNRSSLMPSMELPSRPSGPAQVTFSPPPSYSLFLPHYPTFSADDPS